MGVETGSKPKADAWASRYMLGHDAASLGVPPGNNESNGSRRSSFEEDRKALKELHQSSLATNAGLGYGLASSISRDLYGNSGNSRRISLTAPVSPSQSFASRPSSPSFAPTIEDPSSGVLSKVCGSVIEPQDKRDRWNCKNCHTVFARDATIYAAPTSNSISSSVATNGDSTRGRQAANSDGADTTGSSRRDKSPAPGTDPGSYYCKSCYYKLFSMGNCASRACGQPVVGSTKEDGPFVRVSSTGELYHGKCFRCIHCNAGGGKPPLGDGIEVIIGMDGKPTCDDCFDKPAPKRSVPGYVTKDQVAREEAMRIEAATRKAMSGNSLRNEKLSASIAELSMRFGKASTVDKSSASSSSVRNTAMPPPAFPASSSSGSIKSPITQSQPIGSLSRSSSGGSNSGSGGPSSSSFSKLPLTGSPPKPRPLTAQFSGDRFDLAAFQARGAGSTRDTQGHLSRSDSRSRSLSPVKRGAFDFSSNGSEAPTNSTPAPAGKCAVCGFGAFEGPQKDAQESVMVGLQSGEQLHRECFNCALCEKHIDPQKPFVRLADLLSEEGNPDKDVPGMKYAHAACAPMATVSRPAPPPSSSAAKNTYALNAPSSAQDHATHQRSPRSRGSSPAGKLERKPTIINSYLPKAEEYSEGESKTGDRSNGISSTMTGHRGRTPTSTPSAASSTIGSSAHQFRSTAGPTPPTRSSFLPSHSSKKSQSGPANPAAGMFSSGGYQANRAGAALSNAQQQQKMPGSSGAGTEAGTNKTGQNIARFGGMQQCPLCERTVTALEGVPGPRGTRWHRSCLVCVGSAAVSRSNTRGICGKKLDSGAKVDVQGRVLCRDCFDKAQRDSRAFPAAVPVR